MCGIVGYIGTETATPILISGLKRLEYRGYDSAGVTIQENGHLETRKSVGKISELEKVIAKEGQPAGFVGIAHTRWATHGPPNQTNAHPHIDCTGTISLVHNGIIENYATLRKKLEALGHTFRTETDTETVAHLIEEAFEGNLEEAVRAALRQIEGTYGLAIMSSRDQGKIVVARKGSPLLIGVGRDGEYFVASDVSAVLAHTREVIYLDDGEMAVLTEGGYVMTAVTGGEELTKEIVTRYGAQASSSRCCCRWWRSPCLGVWKCCRVGRWRRSPRCSADPRHSSRSSTAPSLGSIATRSRLHSRRTLRLRIRLSPSPSPRRPKASARRGAASICVSHCCWCGSRVPCCWLHGSSSVTSR